MTDHLGQQLGNYHLTRLLGRGGFAEVYQGEHVLLGTTVAIKVLHTQVSPEEMAHFQQEARLLASLKHPHIVRVFDFGINGQTPYLIMDYASHGTLRTYHARGTRLPLPTVVDYLKQIAEALQYAHERKVVHRDVKPENMLIGEQGEILLSDFGIALIAQSSRQQSTQKVIGTAAYMSPEQIQGKPRAASDQYSLGIVVYEWLCGRRPFHGSFTELFTQHLFAPPPSLCEQVPTLSREVEQVVLTALAKDPKERFESVRAFATALERACQGTLPGEPSRPADPSSVSTSLSPSPTTATTLVSPLRQPAEAAVISTALSYPATVIQNPPSRPDLPMPTRATDKRTVSRRAVLVGVAGGVVIATAGGVSLFLRVRSQPSQIVTTQEPTTTHQGKLFFTYRGHSWGGVSAVAWSPDGKRIASGAGDLTAQVWNASDGKNVLTYKGHFDLVNAVAWSPNGQWIASGSGDKTVQVWTASYGIEGIVYGGHTDIVNAVAWSPAGQWIASGSYDNSVQVWNASDGSHLFTYHGHSNGVNTVAWSPDGQRIASGSYDRQVQVWNASDGSNVFVYKGHYNVVKSVAWSPDGKRIASGSYDNTVQVWNASDGSHLSTYKGHSDGVNAVAWSPGGQRIASGSWDKTVQVWNASDGSHLFTYHGHSSGVNTIAWSPDGQRIASGSGYPENTVQVWQAV